MGVFVRTVEVETLPAPVFPLDSLEDVGLAAHGEPSHAREAEQAQHFRVSDSRFHRVSPWKVSVVPT